MRLEDPQSSPQSSPGISQEVVVVFGARHVVREESAVYPDGQAGGVQEPQSRTQQGQGVLFE